MLETQTEKYKATTQTLEEAKTEIARLQQHLWERDKGHRGQSSLGTNQEAPSQIKTMSGSPAVEVLQLQQELQAAQSQLATLQEKVRELDTGSEARTSQTQGQMEALQEVIRTKDNQVSDLEAQLAAIEEDRDKMRRNMACLEAQIVEYNSISHENQQLKTEILRQQETSQQELEQLRREKDELRESLENVNEKYTKETGSLKNERNELKQKISDLENSMQEVEELKIKMKGLEEKLAATEEKVGVDNGELDLLKTDYELLTDTLKLKNERIQELEQKVINEKHEIEMELLRGDNERLSQEVNHLVEKLESSEKNIAEKGRRLDALREEGEELQERLGEREKELAVYVTSVNSLQREKEQQALDLDQLNEELEEALVRCKRTEELERGHEELTSQLYAIQQECQCYQIQNDELRNRINVQHDLSLSQQCQIEVAGREKEQLMKDSQQLGRENEELMQEILKLRLTVENSDLPKPDEEAVGKLSSMETVINRLKEDNLAWKVKVQSLEDKIVGLQKDLEVSQDNSGSEMEKLQDFYKQELLDKDEVINSLQSEIQKLRETENKPRLHEETGMVEWQRAKSSGSDSIEDSKMESMVEDLLYQSEAAVEREVESQKEAAAENWERENVCEEMEMVQEEILSVSCRKSMSSPGEHNTQEKVKQVECSEGSNPPLYQREFSHDSLVADENLEDDVKDKTGQSLLSEVESFKREKSQEEIRSVLNLEPDVSLDSENFLLILKTLESQKNQLLKKLKQTEAERDKLRSRVTGVDEISDDSLNTDDSIDVEKLEPSSEPRPQPVVEEITEREAVDDIRVNDSEVEDAVDGPDSLEMEDNTVATKFSQTIPPREERDRGGEGSEVTRTTREGQTQVRQCMLSSGDADSVIVEALTNPRSVVSVENFTVQTLSNVSSTTLSGGEGGIVKSVTDTDDGGCNGNGEDEYDDIEPRLSMLMSENKALEVKLVSAMTELNKKSKECQKLKSQHELLSNQFDVFKASFSDITIRNENLEYDNEELSDKYENLQREFCQLKSDYGSLQDHYDVVGDENHVLRCEHDQLTQKYDAVVSENSSLLQSLSDSEVTGSKVLRESEEIVRRLTEIELENSRLSQQLSRSQKENSEFEIEIEQLNGKLYKVKTDCENYLLEKSELFENHRKLTNEMKICESEKLENLRKLQSMQQRLEEQIQENKDIKCQEISQLESLVDELRDQNKTLALNNQNAESKICGLLEEANEYQESHKEEQRKREEKIIRLSEECGGLHDSLKEKERALHALEDIVRDSEGKLHRLQQEAEALRTQNMDLSEKLTEWEVKLLSSEEEIEARKEKSKELEDLLKSRESENEKMKFKVEELEGNMMSRVSENEELKVKVEEFEGKMRSRESENEELKSKLEELETTLKKEQIERARTEAECCNVTETLRERERVAEEGRSREEEMRSKLEEALAQISESEEHYKQKDQEIEKLIIDQERCVKTWEQKVRLKDEEIDRLTELNRENQRSCERQTEQHRQDLLQKEEELKQVQEELRRKGETEIEILNQTIAGQEQRLEAQDQEMKDMQHEILQLKDVVRKEKEEIKSINEEKVRNLQEMLKNQESENGALRVNISALEEDNSDLTGRLTELELKCEGLKTELRKEVESRLCEKNHQIQQLREDIGELKENIGNSESRPEEDHTEVVESLGKLQTALSRITASMSVESDLSELAGNEDVEPQSEESQQSVTEPQPGENQQSMTESAEQNWPENRENSVSAIVEKHKLQETLRALELQVQELQKDKNALKLCLKEARHGTSEGDREELEAVWEENSRLMEEIKTLSAELERWRETGVAQIRDTSSTEKLQETIERLTTENIHLKQNFSDLQVEIEQGQQQILQMASMFQQSVSTNEELRNEVVTLREELEGIVDSRESFEQALAEVEQTISQSEDKTKRQRDEKTEEVVQDTGEMRTKEEFEGIDDEDTLTVETEDSVRLKKFSEVLVSLTLANSQNVVLKEENENLRKMLKDGEKSVEGLSLRGLETENNLRRNEETDETLERNQEDISSLLQKSLAEREEYAHILEEQIKLLSNENTEMRAERERIIEEVKVHRDITSEMRDSVEKSRQDVCQIRDEQAGFKLKMDEIIQEKEKLGKDLMKRITENQELRSKVGVLSEENDLLRRSQESFERVKEERDELLTMQEKLLEDLTDLQGRYEAVHTMMEETKQECNQEMEKLRQQLGVVNRDVGELKTSIDVLQRDLQAAQEQKAQLITSLEEKTHLLVVTEKERQKELNDKFNKELQNQRRAGGGSSGGERESNAEVFSGGGSIFADPGESGQTPVYSSEEASAVYRNTQCPGSENDEVTSDATDSVTEKATEVCQTGNPSKITDSDRGLTEQDCQGGEDRDRDGKRERTEEEDMEGSREEEDELVKLQQEHQRQMEGLRYEMEERLEMSLKDREFELQGKFDIEKRELVKQMEQWLGQRVEAVKAEKHKEFVEAMQKVRKDQGRKLQREVKGRQKVHKQLQVSTASIPLDYENY